MKRWLTTLLCRHAHYRRERDAKGVLFFVCDGCDRRVPAIIRTPAERKAMLKTFRPVLEAKARRVDGDKVIPMKGRSR